MGHNTEMTLDLDWLVRTFADVNWRTFTIFSVICYFPFFFSKGFFIFLFHCLLNSEVRVCLCSCLKSVLYVSGKCLTFPQQTGVNDGVEVWSPSSGDDLILHYVNAHFRPIHTALTITRLQHISSTTRQAPIQHVHPAKTSSDITHWSNKTWQNGAVWIGL